MKIRVLFFLGIIFISNLVLGQRDASLTFVDLIAHCNQQVEETLAQHIVNWDEVPINYVGVKSMRETFFQAPIDTTKSADTLVYIANEPRPANRMYAVMHEYEQLPGDTIKVVVDGSSTIIYFIDKVLSQEENGNSMRN